MGRRRRAAAKHLGIQLRTLYAYVSRGRSAACPAARGRPRLYALADLERLRVRRDARAGHGAVAAGALRWGEPVLDSAITAITPRGPAYRGRLAVELAATGTRFENVAELLWSRLPAATRRSRGRASRSRSRSSRASSARRRAPLDVMPLLVQIAALARSAARAIAAPTRSSRAAAAHPAARRRARARLRAARGHARARRGSVADDRRARARSRRRRAAGLDRRRARPARRSRAQRVELHRARRRVDRCRSVRVRRRGARDAVGPASTAAPSEEVARFADEVGAPEQRARRGPRAAQKRGEVPPGFGHPLYPAGDPRAPPLLAPPRRLGDTQPRAHAARDRRRRRPTPQPERRRRARRAGRRARRAARPRPGLFAVARARRLARARARAARRRLPAAAARALHRRAELHFVTATPAGCAGSNSAFDTGRPRSTSVSTVPAPPTYVFGRNRK